MQMNLRIPGFECPDVDAFFKLGGSLFNNLDNLKRVAEALLDISKDHRIVIFPGGGPIDKLIERFNTESPLSPEIPHHACALAQDQSGLIFSNFSEKFAPIADFENLRNILDSGRIPLLLPSKLILSLGIFEKTFDISSDSIGAFFASFLEADRYILLKSIDGIRKPGDDNSIYKEMNARDLQGGDEVDVVLPRLIIETKQKCWIINGLHPQRIRDVMEGHPTIATELLSR